jgi:hypothetical protein
MPALGTASRVIVPAQMGRFGFKARTKIVFRTVNGPPQQA